MKGQRNMRPGIAKALVAIAIAWPATMVLPASATDADACRRACVGESPMPGIEVLLAERQDLLRGKRVGLVTNPTGVDRTLRSSIDLLARHPAVRLVALFGPEHGVRGNVQAGEPIDDARDAATGLPVYSLYGEHREPTPAMLDGIDVLLVDLQDIGTRVYTYPSTLANVMRAAKRAGIAVIVLDRPNPVGGVQVEGPLLQPEYASFVGQFPIPGIQLGIVIAVAAQHVFQLAQLAAILRRAFARAIAASAIHAAHLAGDAGQLGQMRGVLRRRHGGR